MKKLTLRSAVLLLTLCCVTVGAAYANVVTSFVPFPTAGDAYTSFTDGNGTIPAGGETGPQWTAGDSVTSSIFVLPTTSVTDLEANWNVQDFLGGGNTETWFVYVNSTPVAMVTLPDDAYNGDILNVSGTVTFAGIAPVAGGYQVELVLQNTVPFGGGSVAWMDGGITGLSYNVNTVPEPGCMVLFGTGVIGLAGLLRRKLGL
jgi:hypothetical protein